MPRIALVLTSAGLGGAERQARLIACALRGAGHEVAVFAMHAGPPPIRGGSAEPAILLPRVESRFRLIASWRMRRAASLLLSWNPDVLLPFCSAANVLCCRISAAGGPVAIWNQRDEGLFPQHPAHERQALAEAAMLIANGPGAAEWIRARSQRFIRVIANATALPAASADRRAWRSRLAVPMDAPTAVMVATFSPAKDHRTLLEAWQQVEAGLPSAWLVLAGPDGGESPGLLGHAERLGLKRIRWTGFTDDIAGLLGAVDVGVLASRSEGLSNAILEYRAAGLPIVGSDIPGIRTAAGHGSLLVPAGDPSALAGALLLVLGDPTTRAHMADDVRRDPPESAALAEWPRLVDELLAMRHR